MQIVGVYEHLPVYAANKLLTNDGTTLSWTTNLTWDEATLAITGALTASGNITLDSDSKKLLLGDDQDFEIFFDGDNQIVGTTADIKISFSDSPVGTGGYGLDMSAGSVTTDTDGGTGIDGGFLAALAGTGGAVSGGSGANVGGTGGNFTFTSGIGGAASGGATNNGGDGGLATLGGGRGGVGDVGLGGDGGVVQLVGGPGSAQYGGLGGDASVIGGAGGGRGPAGATGGDGGDTNIAGGAGGVAVAGTQGDGGDVFIDGGAGDTAGNIFLGRTRGITRIGSTANYTAFAADGSQTMAGTATVWNDMQFQISDAKVTPASLLPSWEAFTANTSEYAFSVNDEVDTSANEIPHSWKQATAGNAHMHITTKAINNTEITYAKFTVTFAYADTNEVWVEAPLTAELTIANPTAALTNFYLDLGDITLTNYLIEAQMRCRVKRIAATTGTEYVGDIFITQVGIHFEEDTIGSRTEREK